MAEIELTPNYPGEMMLGGVNFTRDELIRRELTQNGYESEATYSAKIGAGQILVCFERLPKLAEDSFDDEEDTLAELCEDQAGFRNVILRTGTNDLGLLLDPTVSDWKGAAAEMVQFYQQHGFSSKFDLDYEKHQLGIYAIDFLNSIADKGMPHFEGKGSAAALALIGTIVAEIEIGNREPCFGPRSALRLNASSIAICFACALQSAPDDEVDQYKADLRSIANAVLSPKLRSEISW